MPSAWNFHVFRTKGSWYQCLWISQDKLEKPWMLGGWRNRWHRPPESSRPAASKFTWLISSRCGGSSPLSSFVLTSKFAQQFPAPRHAHLVHLSVHFCARWSLKAFTVFVPFPLLRFGPAKVREQRLRAQAGVPKAFDQEAMFLCFIRFIRHKRLNSVVATSTCKCEDPPYSTDRRMGFATRLALVILDKLLKGKLEFSRESRDPPKQRFRKAKNAVDLHVFCRLQANNSKVWRVEWRLWV